MANNYKKYTLILQNKATNKEYIINELLNTSSTSLYYEFQDFQMPTDAPEGEYKYALIWNIREDVTFDISDDLLETIVKYTNGQIPLKYLNPEIGILKYGNGGKNTPLFKNKNQEFYYRKK